ncbi:Disintegrin and metalloproteinase domain-containing protein 9 [Merluccius polli]|uniref:Disintegrin and metalloproteinase domain-containing protein 9 n=1 Tax=Merluccius polli TaxID=89951 RepID=A0AA47NX79_MERPO|nr:Disintegrin and metalloproteinase domain-containing protein 9 [Merluccius polli]
MVAKCLLAAVFLLSSSWRAESTDIPKGFSSTGAKYTVVYPRVSHRWRSSANTTSNPTERNEAETVSYELSISDRKHLLVLKQNRDFISNRFVQYSHHSSGYSKSTRANHVHCYYHGHVDGYEDSLVILSTCSGLRGVIVLQNKSYGLEPVPQSLSNEHHLYPLQDVMSGHRVCGVTNEMPAAQEHHSPFDPGHTLSSLLRRKRNLPQTNYVELVFVVDNLRYIIKQRNETAVTEEMVEMANLLDGYYKQLNIRVALVGLEIFKDANPFEVELPAGDVLTSFVRWRKVNLLPRIQHDVAQLIVGLPRLFDGAILGMAFVGTICSAASSGGINVFQNNQQLPFISTVVAHELGHNLGMNHDNNRCQCDGKSCIMAASAGGSTNFSICSADDFEVLVRNGGGLCLKNPPTHSIGLPRCGNGLLEDKEQCDCGTPEECTNECCEAATCRFSAGSYCADGLCCSNCQIKVAGTPCRESVNACDLPEYCFGDSGFCPEDFYVMDGLSCEDASAYCYEGRCQTYDFQCKTLFEEGAKKADDQCYLHANVKGDKFGNCGGAGPLYTKCKVVDAMCGKLQCTNVDANKPPPGGVISNEIVNGSKCVNADFNLGPDVVDPAYVNPGSPCAKAKTCLDFKCVNASVLLPNLDCDAQTTCNGHGVSRRVLCFVT